MGTSGILGKLLSNKKSLQHKYKICIKKYGKYINILNMIINQHLSIYQAYGSNTMVNKRGMVNKYKYK